MTGLDLLDFTFEERMQATWPDAKKVGAVQLDIGYFANVIDLGGMGLAISTDGIGTKAMIAKMLDKYDTVGIDCVAMNVNDIICVGATPTTMVDYITLDQPSPWIVDRLSIGLVQGALQAGIAIAGGETAYLGKEMVHGFDLSGTAVGYVSLDHILNGAAILEGDVLIGIESNGIHSNGFTLARRVFQLHAYMGHHNNQLALAQKFDGIEHLGAELLRPTHIYVQEALHLLWAVPSLKALVHITGGGLLNLNRVAAPVGFVIDCMPDVPPIFALIKQKGDIDDTTMYSTFNMGIGFCVVVGPEDVEKTLKVVAGKGKRVHLLGYATNDPERRIRLVQQGLVGYAKHFERLEAVAGQ